jgi:hypothetical protein
VQLDAPRHLFLHTRKSFGLLAARAGLQIEKWFCDSTSFQFWGSELYQRKLPFFKGSEAALRRGNYFSKRELNLFTKKTKIARASTR